MAAAEIGIPAIIAEAGGCGLVEPAAVAAHVRGLDRVLALLGMSDDPAAGAPGATGSGDTAPSDARPGEAGHDGERAGEPVHLGRFLWLRATSEGWWEPAVRPGEPVAEGQILGTVSSLDGAQIRQTVLAPSAGVPLFLTSSPAVTEDGLLLGLGAG